MNFFPIALFVMTILSVTCFHLRGMTRWPSKGLSRLSAENDAGKLDLAKNDELWKYVDDLRSIVVSGFISKTNNFADTFVLSKLFEKNKWDSITAVSDDLSFAKKRILNPNTVYSHDENSTTCEVHWMIIVDKCSGLIDSLKINVQRDNSLESLESCLLDSDTWLAFNISQEDVMAYSRVATNLNLKRVVFGVNIQSTTSKDGEMFEEATTLLKEANVVYSIVKFSEISTNNESKFPYRIVRGELPIPTEGTKLASQDLHRVLLEIVDLPKTFNKVYGIGAASQLDQEILVYMKSQGWPERVQVAVLMGDVMERIEKKYIDEILSKKSNKLTVTT